MILTISMIVIIASLFRVRMESNRCPQKTSSRVISVLMNTLTVAVIGLTMPWNSGLHFFWSYGLVAACVLYAGAVAWRAAESKLKSAI